MTVEISVIEGDLLTRPCDVVILKHADGFYGVDAVVARRIGFSAEIPSGHHAFTRGAGIEARKVLFLGVGALQDFRYEAIRNFASRSLEILASGNGNASRICSPIHGPGYGLDEKEAVLSLVGGFRDAIENKRIPPGLQVIEIVEQSHHRAERFRKLLQDVQLNHSQPSSPVAKSNLSLFGAASEQKPKLFVAMPFADEFSDVWDVAITDASVAANVICERIKEQPYIGDIVTEIKRRVESSVGLLAVLDGANPNVFLELGYAWALQKPTILMAAKSDKLPFDVRGQRCLIYTSIGNLRTQLITELQSLKAQGIFGA